MIYPSNELVLQMIWKYQYIKALEHKTTDGQHIQIIQSGHHNDNEGPDFLQAKVIIDGILWVGSIEIHIKTSDWDRHKHSENDHYNNTILHVVYEHDVASLPNNIPILELKDIVYDKVINNANTFLTSTKSNPCDGELKNIPKIIKYQVEERSIVDRLERKSNEIIERVKNQGNNWEEVTYQTIAKHFGIKTNNDAFLALSQSIPLKILQKHSDDLFAIESLLFGGSGLITTHNKDVYPKKLLDNYLFYAKKYGVESMQKVTWRFSRMRPTSFPTIKISQFSQFILLNKSLFSQVINCDNYSKGYELFNCKASSYWDDHYTFDNVSTQVEVKHLGKDVINTLIINSLVPIQYAYGKYLNQIALKDQALQILTQTPKEINAISKQFKEYGWTTSDAYQTQAMVELYTQKCINKRCLDCAIGNHIIKS